MIETCTGAQIISLMDRVEAYLPRYREIVICTPYIDSQMAARIYALTASATQHGCGIRVITSSNTSDCMIAIGAAPAEWRRVVVIQPRLHAKVYLAIARYADSTEAIVTSANLTRAGTSRNIEFGVRIDGSSIPGRSLLHQIQQFLTKMAA